MIVGVKPWENAPHYTYYVVPNMDRHSGHDRDKARKIAFRFQRKENERDFNQLVQQTMIIETVDIPTDVAKFLGS